MPAVGVALVLIALWLIIRAASGGLIGQILSGFKTGG